MRLLNVYDLLRYRKCPRSFQLGLTDYMNTEPDREPLSGEAAYALRDLSYKHFFHMHRSDGVVSAVVDLLIATPSGWEIVFDTNALYIRETHVWEAALMIYLLRKAGCNISYVTALCLRSGYVCDEKPDYLEMYYEVDLTRRALSKLNQLPEVIKSMCSCTETQPMWLNERCIKPRECPWWNECKAALPQPNVFSVADLDHTSKFKLYNRGIVSYEDCLASDALNGTQKQQVIFELEKREPLVNYAAVKKFIKSLWYPMAFLDFESWQPAIPRYEGMKPFEQCAFLYSLHVLRDEAAPLEHYDLLVKPGEDPRRSIAEGLARDIPQGACIIVYSSGLEKHVLKTLSERFPDLKPTLHKHLESVRDLLNIFRNKDYYDWRMHGSCSLKRVYPAFLNESDIDYNELDQIHNGEDAMYTYIRMAHMDEEEYTLYDKRMRDYCSLDTYAMYRIVTELIKQLKKKELI